MTEMEKLPFKTGDIVAPVRLTTVGDFVFHLSREYTVALCTDYLYLGATPHAVTLRSLDGRGSGEGPKLYEVKFEEPQVWIVEAIAKGYGIYPLNASRFRRLR